MAQIKVNDLTFYYEGSYDNIFEHVNLQIDTDWRCGLIGRNGKGKTTLLKLLTGVFEYSGSITGPMECVYFPYTLPENAHPSQTTMELLEELNPNYELWKVCRELGELSVDSEVLNRSFCTLSGGEQTKILLALLFSGENRFLLIDEPTNHLDMEGREKTAEYLRKKKGFLLVSHDKWFLDQCVDHVLVLERQTITVMQGNFTSWQEQKAKRDAHALAQNERLQKDISHLKEAACQAEEWSNAVEKTKLGTRTGGLRPDRGFIGHKAAKMMKRSQNTQHRMEKAIREKEGLLNNLETAEELKLFPLTYHKERLIKAEDLSLFYGEKPVCQGVSFELKNSMQLAFKGRNGCGKSSVLKKILGEEIESRGELFIASNLVISYVPQDVSRLSGGLLDYARERELPEHLFLALLRKLDFPRVQFEKDMSCYSEGQKKKVALAASLLAKAHLYIWDEPLNYIDIFSRMQLAELIRTYRPTMLLVEHDRSFLEEIGAEQVELPARK
ncbi:MAG: ABC-F type ribosomal protection protein [Lachnospiraceae bacterium]|jgi:lincosamide and streptogramin A transport system ATP-binding/permease protein|uniref:ribosomal protection-like ABC-F family protein n=1 Tax=Candidatus Merdisoma sp. JLR.KK006 TaxID=3112626 RepID=UPI002FEF589E|nr:ABC-F type ribosomal protection protein [Lachnospiraceae bacterium]